MTELAISTRVKRGFHRVGLALSIVLGAFALAGGAIFSWDNVGSQRDQFLARQCVVNEMNNHSPGNPWTDSILQDKCHSSKPSAAELEEWKQSANRGFSYITTLASYLAVTALVASLVGLGAYFSVAAISWIVRGFMRG